MGCPYTWFVGLITSASASSDSGRQAKNLHVQVIKYGEELVRVTLPAQSARWLIELIPTDVLAKIREERIPLDLITDDLKTRATLSPREIFTLNEENRVVKVWLE